MSYALGHIHTMTFSPGPESGTKEEWMAYYVRKLAGFPWQPGQPLPGGTWMCEDDIDHVKPDTLLGPPVRCRQWVGPALEVECQCGAQRHSVWADWRGVASLLKPAGIVWPGPWLQITLDGKVGHLHPDQS